MKRVEARPVERQQQAGIGAELAGAHRQRRDERARRSAAPACGERAGQQQHRD